MSLALPFSSFGSTDKLIRSDRAVFRLSGIVFFSSDVVESVKALNVFKCLGSKPSQRSFTEIYSSGDFSRLTKNPHQKTWSNDKLLSLIKIEKLKIAALGKSKDSLSIKELRSLSPKCAQLEWESLSDGEKSLLISEIFLRDRFNQEKDVFNRLVEYSRSLSIQEAHEVYANQVSDHLKAKYESAKSKLEVVKLPEKDLNLSPIKNDLKK